jgi:molybdopterin synthase catalytic subunit
MMHLTIQLTRDAIRLDDCLGIPESANGAQVFFSGHVRDLENDQKIEALLYEAYQPMAERELGRLAFEIHREHPISTLRIVHRLGVVPVRAAAIIICVTAVHRSEALEFIRIFMNRLKQDVPIWKIGTLPAS